MTLHDLLPLLRCPGCREPFVFDDIRQSDTLSDSGVLTCSCAEYPVLDGVPIVRRGTLDRRSIADATVIAPGPTVAEVTALVRSGRALDALVDLLSAPVCPWPLHQIGALRRLSLREPVRSAGLRLRRRRTRQMLEQRAALTAEDWLAAFYWHAPEVYDPFNYFFFRFGTPRFLATLGLLTPLPRSDRPVLDLACGYGHHAFSLGTLGQPVVGADQNMHQAWVARHYIATDAAFVCADADAPLPFADGAFSSAYCSDAFHYVADKAGCLSELDRATDGGPVLLATTGNRTVGEPDGDEQTPQGYAALLDGWSWTVHTEADLVASYLDGVGPDLSASSDPSEVDRTKWLSYAATKTAPEAFLRQGERFPAWPHAQGPTSVNPLYNRHGDRITLSFPSPWYESENGGASDYMPASATLGPSNQDDLVAAAALVSLPDRYARLSGRPRVLALNRAAASLRARLSGP